MCSNVKTAGSTTPLAVWDRTNGNHPQSHRRRSRHLSPPRWSSFILSARLQEPRWASKRQNKYAIHASPSRPPWNVHNPQTKTRKEVRDRAEDRGIFEGVEVGEKISTNYRRRAFWSAYTIATRMLILKTLISIWKTRREANSDCLPHPQFSLTTLPIRSWYFAEEWLFSEQREDAGMQ